MGEVVSDGQVKVGYLRAIGKVHPDKVRFFSSPPKRFKEKLLTLSLIFGGFLVA